MSDDMIRRRDAIDAIERIFDRCEEIEAHFPDGDPDKTGYEMFPDYMIVWKYLHQLPSAQQTCEYWDSESNFCALHRPSAQPERKEGEWIDEPVYKKTMDGKTWDGYTYCSVCKEMHKYGYRSDFCSNCGARMKHNDSNVLGALEGKEQVENILYGYDNIDDDEYEDDLDWEEPADLEMGYDPYLGCYTDDC